MAPVGPAHDEPGQEPSIEPSQPAARVPRGAVEPRAVESVVVDPEAARSDRDVLQARAEAVAAQLGLPVESASRGAVSFTERRPSGAGTAPEPSALFLVVTALGLELRESTAPMDTGIRVDFRDLEVRTGTGNLSRKQPLGRAVGERARRVLDATAGLGHDAVLLAGMGLEVVALERHPIIAALLADGVERAERDPRLAPTLRGRISVVRADAIEHLRQLPADAFDVIYIDPMFPPKRRDSARARKSIRLVRALVGDDPDAAALLEVARERAPRVVVKRHRKAPELAPGVHHAIRGSNVRYDVYCAARSPA